MTMEEVIFYEYPDKAYVACKGVTVSNNKNGKAIWGYQSDTNKPIKKHNFVELCQAIGELGLDLPVRFSLIINDYKHTGLFIKPSGLIVIKPISPLEAKTSTVSFQFDKECISSFTRAIENATKTKEIFQDYQYILRNLRQHLHK